MYWAAGKGNCALVFSLPSCPSFFFFFFRDSPKKFKKFIRIKTKTDSRNINTYKSKGSKK